VSGTPHDGDAGWLRYEGDGAGAADSTAADRTDQGTPAADSAWLRHDLPDPGAVDATGADGTGIEATGPGVTGVGAAGQTPHSPWLSPDVAVERSAPSAAEAHDTGVPPTIVLDAEESTPPHVSPETRPLPGRVDDDLAAAAPTSRESPVADEGADPDPGRRPGRRDDESAGGLAVLGAAVKEFAIVVGMALVLSFIVKTWLLQAFYIPSGSM
jgi:hypothetical protein